MFHSRYSVRVGDVVLGAHDVIGMCFIHLSRLGHVVLGAYNFTDVCFIHATLSGLAMWFWVHTTSLAYAGRFLRLVKTSSKRRYFVSDVSDDEEGKIRR